MLHDNHDLHAVMRIQAALTMTLSLQTFLDASRSVGTFVSMADTTKLSTLRQ